MDKEIKLREWIKKFDNGDFNSPDVHTQIKAGWYDWFCRDESLKNKTIKLGTHLKQIIESPKLNPETQYVFFKNNCPMVGSLYDDFRICDIESGDVVFTIVPKSGFTKDNGKGQVHGYDKDGKFGQLFEGSWSEIKNWFLNS